MNGTLRMSGELYMTQVTEAAKQKTFWPPIWTPIKISPPKVEKLTYGRELYHHANFHADRWHLRRDSPIMCLRTLHHRHGQLDVCEQAQVKYGQDGAAVGWNKIQHVNVE